ncbi:glycosyltransferase family A protein [Proteus faecis]|uniref:Glycosyltransferase family A protein n=1 Tax=Proteus faecis TaxID=2050967 RepID=A0AAW7CMS4_9GAMM|nr:glycosyltransferase family A protein [Proteus faecis]MDL5167696.1 glycosyltransferase family A protein [Proteus faecis]MDL5275681.1 glycosyltransferase family A protein [Proteus faecis]MDL5279094.1 glycosyltransferase family A protein [Proteus faecis]MDL5308096.1 glycosyltransferase family A protein [Proteus faecis]MDL5311812.1 glycosyltransferase family A protein [Proteus faecis]
MRYSEFSLLISTIAGRIQGVDKLIKSLNNNDIKIIIVIQQYKKLNHFEKCIINKFNLDKNITIILTETTGVTKSRNIALKNLQTKFALFSDDDVVYNKNSLEIIKNSFDRYNHIGFLTFSIQDEYGNLLKNYPNKTKKHTKLSILKVGTIEIAINRELCANFFFPEDMGAGQYLFCCDEPVFLGQILNSKISGLHIPEVICTHPKISSGKGLKSKNALLSRYHCFNRIFGKIIGNFVFLLFLIKNFRKVI